MSFQTSVREITPKRKISKEVTVSGIVNQYGSSFIMHKDQRAADRNARSGRTGSFPAKLVYVTEEWV